MSIERFNEIIEEVDHQLSEQGYSIPDRLFWAEHELLYLFNEKFNDFHVKKWYAKRYGKRTIFFNFIGTMVIQIRNDPWKAVLPVNFHPKPKFTWEHLNYHGYNSLAELLGDRISLFNCLENLTDEYLKSFSEQEKRKIARTISSNYYFFRNLYEFSNEPFIKEAKADFESAAFHILNETQNFGNSKWCSLQAVEKIFKSLLKSSGEQFPKTHDLIVLAEMIENRFSIKFSLNEVLKVQCSPGVRYGEPLIEYSEAIDAYQASLKIGRKTMIHFSYKI